MTITENTPSTRYVTEAERDELIAACREFSIARDMEEIAAIRRELFDLALTLRPAPRPRLTFREWFLGVTPSQSTSASHGASQTAGVRR